jgi:hypothetical protein
MWHGWIDSARALPGCAELARAGHVSTWEAQTWNPDAQTTHEYNTWAANPWERGTSSARKRVKRDDDKW